MDESHGNCGNNRERELNTVAFKKALAAGVVANPLCKFLAKDYGVLKTLWVGDPRAVNVKPAAITSDVDVWLEAARERSVWKVAYAELPTVYRGQWHLTWQVNSGGMLTLWRDRGDVFDLFLTACVNSLGSTPVFKPEVFGMAIPLDYGLVREALEGFGQPLAGNFMGGERWKLRDKQELYTFHDSAVNMTYFVERT